MLNTFLPCNSVTAIVAVNRFNEVCYVSRDRIFRGMVSLLSPCTLPVIPLFVLLAFAAQKHQLVAMLFGMVMMFTLVASLITVASDWVVSATLVGRWLALALLSLAALALIFPSFAQRIAGPAFTPWQCHQYSQHSYPWNRLGAACRAGGRAAVVALCRTCARGHSQSEYRRA
ncbi:Uncharacterised protein [Leclercia adecarboxylata]|uniref:Uncharacterized protein n=1 Tax=Leclercia adecarboxylata TaxID=83655 RepID=A0A4U9HUN0_9ENTR|nr:Uncharacterised protein [Leclercia adecarboxylata]